MPTSSFVGAHRAGIRVHRKALPERLLALCSALLLGACAHAASPTPVPADAGTTPPRRAWWKEVVVYQVYPRSFQDSDHNGVGDIRGLTSRLDYIKSLGVDVVWLNPVYQSPNDDGGYDISDYRAIMPEMGTMADFDALLRGLHRRGLKLVMDLVVNHTSDEHRWFQQSRKSRDNPYRDYYHWWPAERGVPARRWSFFDEEGSAWRFDSTTRAYYLHYFSRKQPDLKWENPRVRREVYDIMRFWFEKGVDGFRMDVIPFISKDTTFPPIDAKNPQEYIATYAKGPRLHEYLREMNREVLSKYDVMTVGEAGGVGAEDALKFVGQDRHELQTFFQFEVVDRWGRRADNWLYADSTTRSLLTLKAILTKWDSVFAEDGWNTVFLGNHDQSRMVSRYGNDGPRYRVASAKMLHTLLLTMRATPYIYNGDEIGMANIRFRDIHDYRDLMTINYYRRLEREGGNLAEFLAGQAEVSRDNGRTPMQWNGDSNAGFTTGAPWIRVNPDYRTVNVAEEERDTGSVLQYVRRMIRLRRAEPTLVYGRYQLLDRDNPEVFAYTRSLAGRTLMIALSFSPRGGTTALPQGFTAGSLLISNVGSSPVKGNELSLQPYQAVVLELRSQPTSGPYYPPAGRWERRAPALVGMNPPLVDSVIAFAKSMESATPRDLLAAHWASDFGHEPVPDPLGPFKDRGDVTGIIVRNGYLVAEWGEPERVDLTFSVTKSFLSSTVGLAWDRRLIPDLHARVKDYVKTGEFDSEHNARITWEDLLRQTSDWEGTLWGKPDWSDRPPANVPIEDYRKRAHAEPGTTYKYNDVRVNLLAYAALQVWRRPLPDVLKEYLMSPIGASNTWVWHGYGNSWVTIDGKRMQSVSGGAHWGGGMWISARDLARFGLLTLRHGRWKDRQILSEAWIAQALTPTHAEPTYGFMNYFLNTAGADGRRPWPSATANTFCHIGNGTNAVCAIPEYDLVVVARWIQGDALDGLLKRVIAAAQPGPAGRLGNGQGGN